MKEVGTSIYRLGEVEIHPLQGYVYRAGQELYLRPKSLQVLLYLIDHCERRVSKEELIQAIWKEASVTDDALVQSVKEIRKVLGDDPHKPEFIKTFPRVGYHLICPVEKLAIHPHPMVNRISQSVIIEETTALEIEFEESAASIITDHGQIRLPAVASNALAGKVETLSRFRKYFERRAAVAMLLLLFLSAAITLLVYVWRSPSPNPTVIETKLPKLPGKKNLAVMYFENQSASRELDWLREGLADMLITDLSRSQNLLVLSRQQLHLLLDRSGYQSGAAIHLDEALDIARKTQAEVIALGSFANLGETTRIDVHLYDSQTGQMMATERLVASKPDEILRQIDLLSLRLAAHLGTSSEAPEAQTGLSGTMTNNLEAYRYYSLALEKAQAYHSTEAIGLWEKAVALDPEFAMAYARIGYTYALVRVNENEKAKPYLEKAFRLSNRLNEKEKLYIQAWYAHANGDNEMAVRAFSEITAKFPRETESYFRLGFLLRHGLNHYDEALRVFEQGIAADPEAKEIYNQLGFVYARFGRYEDAIAAHCRYVQLAPDEPNAYDSLGMTYNEAGHYEEALRTFNRALSLNPDFHFANRHIGDSYFLIGRLNEALQQYERYLRVAPSDWDRAAACNLMVRVYLAKNDMKNAENCARREAKYKNNYGGLFRVALTKGDLLEIEKLKAQIFSSPQAKAVDIMAILGEQDYLLGTYYLKTGDQNQALQHLQKSQALSTYYWNSDSTIAALVDAYLELGRFDEAIAECERLLKINANFALTHYQLGRAYQQKGEPDKARAAYLRFLEIWSQADTDAPLLLDAKKRLAAF